MKPADRDGSGYIFYLGSFLGDQIYVKNTKASVESYTITISGAVRYGHFVLGYTSRDEFEENIKSSAPYFDIEIWQNGMLHSGSKAVLETIDYDGFYDASIYWAKVTSVSSQVPSSGPASISVSMMYEPFIAAGATVAFVGRATTNSPLEWFKFTTNYKSYLQDCSGDTWGPHHEFHHHFQANWGMTTNDTFGADTETTNNIVTLISYSYFSKVSQRRTENNEPDGDDWNAYTSASWCVNDAMNTMHAMAGGHHLAFYSVFLHSFGQDLMIKAINIEKGRTNELWYGVWTNLTELDFTYFWRNIYKTDCLPLKQEEVDKYKDKHYTNFIPIACRYQTGIGYKVKGTTNWIRTMYPFMIKYGEDKILNFNEKMVVPNGFTYTIKSVTNPAHGSISKQSENDYVYKPDINSKLSGEMEFTIGLKKDDDPSFAIDDIVIYVELEQTKSIVDRDRLGDILDRTIYIYPTGVIPTDPIAEFNDNFAGSESHITIPNNISQKSDANMIIGLGNIVQNQISVLEGKFEVEQGKYRFALKCRNHGALYFSYDGGKTYELGCKVQFECSDEKYYTSEEGTTTTKEFMSSQWVYFKLVMCHKQEVSGRRLFANIGIERYNLDGEISESVTDLKKARSLKYEAEPVFYAKDVYPKVWTQ